MLRTLIALGGLFLGQIAAPAPSAADVTRASLRASGPTAPCTPYVCPARQSAPWTHFAGFGVAVVAAITFARRDEKSLSARRDEKSLSARRDGKSLRAQR